MEKHEAKSSIHRARSRASAIMVVLLVLPLLLGCNLIMKPDDELTARFADEIAEQKEKDQRAADEEKGTSGIAEDLTLPEGVWLLVRLNYGGELGNESAWYRVRVDNPRNGWYDYVEYSSELGLGGDPEGNSHSYDFNAENFNRQSTSGDYDPKDVDGEYTMTVSNSRGWTLERTIKVQSGRIVGSATYAFDVP